MTKMSACTNRVKPGAMQRGDFRAEWNLKRREGWIRQCANPYSIDTVLRITHTLLLAMEGGFQLPVRRAQYGMGERSFSGSYPGPAKQRRHG